jgi:ABC-type multidrug transport system ATPase subunit
METVATPPHLPVAAAPAAPAAAVSGAAGAPALAIRSLTRRFEAGVAGCSATVEALRGVDLDVAAGDIVAVLGAHGAGKSTLLLCAAGLMRADRGAIVWFGRAQAPAPRPAGIAHIPERSSYYSFLTAREALEYYATLHELAGADRAERLAGAVRRTGLSPQAAIRVSLLPRGAQQRLAFAQALLVEPSLLLIDEPFAGADAATRHDLGVLLRELAGDGAAVLLAARDAATVRNVATRAVMLERGQIRTAFALGAPRPATRWLEIDVADARAAIRALASRVPVRPAGAASVRVPLDAASPEETLAVCRVLGLAVLGTRVVEDEVAPPSADRMRRHARVAEQPG